MIEGRVGGLKHSAAHRYMFPISEFGGSFFVKRMKCVSGMSMPGGQGGTCSKPRSRRSSKNAQLRGGC